jgi:uroporphyrinogen decarboxylase
MTGLLERPDEMRVDIWSFRLQSDARKSRLVEALKEQPLARTTHRTWRQPMNSKERVARIVNHERADRVAIDFAAKDEVVVGLRERLGLRDDESLEDRLGVDIRAVGPRFTGRTEPLQYADPTVDVTADGVHRDIWGVGFKANQTSDGFYMDLATNPLKDLDEIEVLDDYTWPTADLWDYSDVANQAHANGQHWVWAHSRGIFEISWFLRGFGGFLEDLAIAPERACAVMDRVEAYLFERTRRTLEAGRGLIDMVEYNDDVGGQGGMLVSPDMWRTFLKPRMVSFIRMCKEYGVKIRYHCCGGIRPIVPDLIEIGVDILNPIQNYARGMEPEGLKRDFGDRLTLNGGIDTQHLLPYASEAEVRRETQRLIDLLGENGGYILAPSHVFQADVPLANVVAVYETALGRGL